MKNVVRIISAAIAASFLLAPMAQAQPRGDHRSAHHHVHKKHHIQKKPVHRHHWSKGQRYSNWKRHAPVRDYHRHGLRKPAAGQQWVKIDNQYLLIGIATGLIAGIASAR